MIADDLLAPEFGQAQRQLDPAPVALETGVSRLDSGQLYVAVRTDMPRCKGRMFAWWFRFAPNTQQYLWWHPTDHVSSVWRETSPLTHVGSTHLVEERLAGSEVHTLQISFVDPRETFAGTVYEDALAHGDVSVVVAAQLGMGPEPTRDDQGRPNMGRMLHIARDTADGLVLRSRFWLGYGTDLPPEKLKQLIPDQMGMQLMQHAHTEFKYLAQFLPSLYYAENQQHETPPDLW